MADACVEPVPISDIYADGIAYIENLGNCIRIAYFTWTRVEGHRQKVVVAKIVRPIASLLSNEEMANMIEEKPVLGMVPPRDGDHCH